MSAEVSSSVGSVPAFQFRGFATASDCSATPAAPPSPRHTATVPVGTDMGAAGTKPLNGESLPGGLACTARADDDPTSAGCNCASCKEKQKLVVGELETGGQLQPPDELRQLHADWIELRQSLKQLYWLHMEVCGGGGGTADAAPRPAAAPIQALMKEKVVRLCQRDPHQLFQRLQGQLQELTLEVKVRLLEQLSRERPGLAQLFLTALLDNYDRLVTAAVSVAPAVHTLEHHHLSRFGLSWESLNKHAYQSVVYMDPMVQNNLPTFISQLRALLSGQQQQRAYADLVRRYLSFDDEMSTVAAQWAAAEARVHEFGQEQATLKAKQRMLREDWELLRAQRKLLQQQVLGRDGVSAEEEEAALQRLVAGCTDDGCDECALTLPTGGVAADAAGDGRPRACGLSELRQALETASRSEEPADGAADPPPPAPAPAAGHGCRPQHGHAAHNPTCVKRTADTRTPPAPAAPAPACPNHKHGAGGGCLAGAATHHQPPPGKPLCNSKAACQSATGSACQAGSAASTIMQVQNSSCQAPPLPPGALPPGAANCHAPPGAGSHKHTYSKAAPTTHRPQPRFDSDAADDSSQNDSCSEQSSSTASQHCSCCYCEVFGHGVPPVAPVSRNYPEIRDRLRLRLDQRRQNHKPDAGDGRCQPAPTAAKEDDRDLSDLLEFIEQSGHQKKRNEKRAAKRERQRLRKLDEYMTQQQEQEQMRNIQEFQRRNPEVTITVVKSGEDGEKAVPLPRPPAAPAQPPRPAAPPAPAPPAAPPAPSTPDASPKKSSPIMEGLARNGLVANATAPAPGTTDSRMVTIRRVMEPGGKEPKVTITLKGDSPEKDRVLMTLVNGQLKNGAAAQQPEEPEKMTKTAKRKLKKALREQQRREEEEAAERAREAAARAAEEEEMRLKALEAAKQKKKNKKKGNSNANNGSTNQDKVQIKQQPAKPSAAAAVNGVDNKQRIQPQTSQKKAGAGGSAAARVSQEPEAAKKPQQPPPARAANGKKAKDAAAAAAATVVSEPAAPARRRPDPRLEPPTQLLQDLALSSSDSEIEDLARAYRIPAGITISRVRGGAGEPFNPPVAAAAGAGHTAASNDKKNKKKKKKKASATVAPEETVPEVTIRKVAAGGQRSVDDYESVFMPAAGGDSITDLVDKEVEAFKRFCLDGPQVRREHRPKVNLNIKDILIKKKPL